MTPKIEIRESLSKDMSEIEELYPAAFPDEDLLPLVRELLAEDQPSLSLIALSDGVLAGHVIFTECGVAEGNEKVALLGPLAVAPACQRQGLGSALIDAGLRQLKDTATKKVLVLGDPDYYSRFGFQADDDVAPPYPLPAEWKGAWRSISLQGAAPSIKGKLSLPQPWRHEALWLP